MNTRERVALLLRGIQSLPTLPDVAAKLLELTASESSAVTDIAAIIERDPSVATRLLKLVNSSFYGVRREINSIQQALMMVGMANLRSLVLSSSVMQLFEQSGKTSSYDRNGLWKHSVACAITARSLARASRVMDPDVAFTAGLIHDVGKVIIDKYLHAEFEKIVQIMETENISMSQAELRVLEATHAEIGEHLCKLWNLPEILCDCVAFHHNPSASENHSKAAALIGVADSVAREIGIGNGGGVGIEDSELDALVKLTMLDQAMIESVKSELEVSLNADVESCLAQ